MITDPVTRLLIAVLYYGAVILLSLFSMLTIYIYLRYGQSKIFGTFVSIAYILLFSGILISSQKLFTALVS